MQRFIITDAGNQRIGIGVGRLAGNVGIPRIVRRKYLPPIQWADLSRGGSVVSLTDEPGVKDKGQNDNDGRGDAQRLDVSKNSAIGLKHQHARTFGNSEITETISKSQACSTVPLQLASAARTRLYICRAVT